MPKFHQFQNAIQCNKYQKYNPRPRYRYVPKIVSWKMAKANKLSFNTENTRGTWGPFSGDRGRVPAYKWTNSFYRSKNP